jgi:hypothetical protein
VSRESAAKIQSWLRHDLAWQSLLQLAEGHGLLPLLYRHLHMLRPGAVPEVILGRLRDNFHKNAIRNLCMARDLVRLLDLLQANGIVAVPYKGPTLSLLAQGNLAWRQFCDLDLLLKKEDIAQAAELLIAQGFRLQFPLIPWQATSYLESMGQLPLLRDRDGLLVELHGSLIPKGFSFRLNWERVRNHLQRLVLAGREVQTLGPEDLLLLLCVHGGKHLWRSLGWIWDLAELIRHQRFDWQRVLLESQRLACERMLFLGLYLSWDMLHAPVPHEIQQRMYLSNVQALAMQVRRQLFADPDQPVEGFESSLFHLRVRERWRDGVRACQYLALAPTVADWTAFRVPSGFSFLYWIFRPLRVAFKYTRRLCEKGPKPA